MQETKLLRKKKFFGNRRETILFFVYVSPWIVGVLAFVLIPMGTSLYFSFHSATLASMYLVPPKFAGFDNYIRIFKDEVFLGSIGTTFLFAFVKIGASVIVSTLFALLLNRPLLFKRISRTLIYIPAVIPVVGSALVWQQMFSSDFSIINYFLSFLGIPSVQWLSYKNALWSVILMSTWCSVGPTMILLIAAFQNIPRDIIEAARMDGANPVTVFFKISLPFVSPTYLYVVITGLIGALQAYSEMQLMTGGGPGYVTTTMAMVVVNNTFGSLGIGYASAQAWFLFIIILIFTIIFFKGSGKVVYYVDEGQ